MTPTMMMMMMMMILMMMITMMIIVKLMLINFQVTVVVQDWAISIYEWVTVQLGMEVVILLVQ